jgi:hypothetical protein
MLSITPITRCGLPREASTKVHAAVGYVTCPECRRIYFERLASLKQRGARVLAGVAKAGA